MGGFYSRYRTSYLPYPGSNAIKILGNKFLTFERKINEKVKLKQSNLKLKEIKILNDKKKISNAQFQKQLKLLKEEVFQTQKNYKEERSLLNKSFQKIQKGIKDLLAQVIKDVSKKRNINVVFLKENVFLFNDTPANRRRRLPSRGANLRG